MPCSGVVPRQWLLNLSLLVQSQSQWILSLSLPGAPDLSTNTHQRLANALGPD